MTSPVGVIGLAYDGYDLQRADLNVMFAITEGLDELPAVRGDDDLIPFRTGRLATTHTADHRPVVATGWVAGTSGIPPAPDTSYRAYLDGLKQVLDPTRLPATLVATLTDGSTRWIPAVPRSLIGGEMVGHEFRPLSISWEALDPYWYGSNGYATLDSGLFLDDGHTLDEGAAVVVTPTSASHELTVDTLGNADVQRVLVSFTGPSVAGPGIEVVTPDGLVGFTYVPALTAGQTLTVDNDDRTVVVASVSQRASLALMGANRHGEYVRLGPGANTVRILGYPASARILFIPTYL
jgi:hypothetical protein